MTPQDKRQKTYSTNIAMACDTSKIAYDSNTGQAKILESATIPPRLAEYAEANGKKMPDGLYGFFGSKAVSHLKSEVMEHLKTRQQGQGFLWDLKATLEFRKKPSATKVSTSLVWRNPEYLEGAFIRVGKASKEAADLLRYFTGDSHAMDRLTLEPWRVDCYAAALSEAYGNIRAVVFDALLSDGSIAPIVRIYDHTLISGDGITPLYEFLSAKDPEQPRQYGVPSLDWHGWGVKETVLTSMDRADIIAYQNVPRERTKERSALVMRRVRLLRQEGRFEPRESEIKELVNRRLDNTRATSTAHQGKGRDPKSTQPPDQNAANG